MLPTTMGNKNTIRVMQAAQQKIDQNQMQILRRIAGPTNYLYITHGFKLKNRRPTGGGRNGETLGSSRAEPTLLSSA